MEVPAPTLTPPVDPARDHLRGARHAAVTLVEYGDFQCPYCGDAYPVVLDLLEQFGNGLRLRVEEDVRSATRSGVPSTPRFFVNAVIHLGSPTRGELGEAIGAELSSRIVDERG
jgi:Thioredoxin